MGLEIERKFLVKNELWRSGDAGKVIKQGYLVRANTHTVRVRIVEDKSYLTIKGARQGAIRPEFEYDIPLADARKLIDSCCSSGVIDKKRFQVRLGGKLWTVDEFFGCNKGLVLAEIELANEAEAFSRPDWVGDEVTEDERYYNAYLSEHPFSGWTTNKPDF